MDLGPKEGNIEEIGKEEEMRGIGTRVGLRKDGGAGGGCSENLAEDGDVFSGVSW